jgi:hypothetical protein
VTQAAGIALAALAVMALAFDSPLVACGLLMLAAATFMIDD